MRNLYEGNPPTFQPQILFTPPTFGPPWARAPGADDPDCMSLLLSARQLYDWGSTQVAKIDFDTAHRFSWL